MSFAKFVNEKYPTKADMMYLLEYVARGAEFVSGYGISTDSVESVFCEFEYVKRYWNKAEEGRRQAVHLVLSYEKSELPMDYMRAIAWGVASLFGENFQIFYGIHTNTLHIHIHFAINTISYTDGIMFTAYNNYGYLQYLREEIATIENNYEHAKKLRQKMLMASIDREGIHL